MNLIEQLGGHEKAKRELQLKIDNSVLQCCMSVTADMIRDALLEHRRENNIFEVGDKVVYKGKAGLSGLFEIETLTKTGKPKTVKAKRFGKFPCRYCEVQHATDKEIAQGYRDE